MHKVEDEAGAVRRRSNAQRRASTNLGATTDHVQVVAHDSTMADDNNYATELSQDFVSSIQSADNTKIKMREWRSKNDLFEQLSTNEELFDKFFDRLAGDLQKPLKLARLGLAARLLVALGCTYCDVATDFMMLNFYRTTGNKKAFNTSLTILCVAVFVQTSNAFDNNKHCSKKTRFLRIFQSLLFLDPAVHTFRTWSGAEAEEGTTKVPKELLFSTKLIEMLFEALPQLILQVGALMRADSISLLPAASICLSVMTAGFIISDLSVGIERSAMTQQIRGPRTAKWCGILPLNFEWVFFLGHMMLVSGYFAAHVLALTVGGLVLPGYAIPAYMVGELGLFLFWGWKYGRARWVGGTSNRLSFFDVLRPEWAVMSFVPIMIFGNIGLLGGRTFAGWMAYKLMLTTTFVVQVCTSGGGLVESIKLSSGSIMTLQLVAAVCAVVGFLLMVRFASDSHRHLLFNTIMTQKENLQRHFTTDDYPLDYTFNTRDEARMHQFAAFHPYFFTESKAKVQAWLLGLRSSDDLFSGAVVPNGVDGFKGQQWSTVFSRVKSRFTYYKDDGANRLITAHLDNLLGEIESRPVITTPSPSPSPQPPTPKELPEIEVLLRARVAALEAELRILKE